MGCGNYKYEGGIEIDGKYAPGIPSVICVCHGFWRRKLRLSPSLTNGAAKAGNFSKRRVIQGRSDARSRAWSRSNSSAYATFDLDHNHHHHLRPCRTTKTKHLSDDNPKSTSMFLILPTTDTQSLQNRASRRTRLFALQEQIVKPTCQLSRATELNRGNVNSQTMISKSIPRIQ